MAGDVQRVPLTDPSGNVIGTADVYPDGHINAHVTNAKVAEALRFNLDHISVPGVGISSTHCKP